MLDVINFGAVVHHTLSPGEQVYQWRRARGLTQPEAARLARVSTYQWRAWESGDVERMPSRYCRGTGGLRCWQWMEVWRRRAGLSVVEAGRASGVSHVTILERERGGGNWEETYQWWINAGLGDRDE